MVPVKCSFYRTSALDLKKMNVFVISCILKHKEKIILVFFIMMCISHRMEKILAKVCFSIIPK